MPIVLAVGALVAVVFRWRPARPISSLLVLGLGVLSGEPLGLLAAIAVVAWLQWDGLRRRQRRRAARAARRRARALRPSRRWAQLADAATAAGWRYAGAVAALPAGPLRERLAELQADVDATVAEAGRLARHGDQAERARREIDVALRRRPVADRDAAAVHAQVDSARRLAGVADADRRALAALLGRLEALAAETAVVSAQCAALEPGDLGDRLAAIGWRLEQSRAAV